MFSARNPDLLTINYVTVAFADRHGVHLCGVCAGIWFAYPECLQTDRTICDLWQVFTLMSLRTMPQKGSHDIHLGVARGRVSAVVMNFFQYDRRFRYPESRAPVLFGNQRSHVARFGQGLYECFRVSALLIKFPPILVGKITA